jgi:poly(A) polymerase Pap1
MKKKAMTAKLGSFRLDVHLKSADNDALCMAPRIIERADFFIWFFDLLKELPEVKDWWVTAKAFVLVILNYDGIKIYFLFVRLHPKNESSAAEDVVTEEYLLLQMNLFFWSR